VNRNTGRCNRPQWWVSTDAAATQAHVRRSPKIVEMAERGGALKDLAAKQALDYAIQMRRGSLYLMLKPKQFVRLCVRRERFES
jgi:hypothetical protein